MRTTLDIAEDVLLAAKELGKREHKSAGQVISELARPGLERGPFESGMNEPKEFLGIRPIPARGIVITNELIDRLRENEFS